MDLRQCGLCSAWIAEGDGQEYTLHFQAPQGGPARTATTFACTDRAGCRQRAHELAVASGSGRRPLGR
jgi:hypothetical protein